MILAIGRRVPSATEQPSGSALVSPPQAETGAPPIRRCGKLPVRNDCDRAELPVLAAIGCAYRSIRCCCTEGKVLLVGGIHDLGGMQGFGAVDHSPAEPVFRHRWEAVARALLAVVAGAVGASGGEFRRSVERMEPGHYLTSGYYEGWLTAAATLAVEHGLVTVFELEAQAGGRPARAGCICSRPGPQPGGRARRARSFPAASWPVRGVLPSG
jgi:hypothetical protein